MTVNSDPSNEDDRVERRAQLLFVRGLAGGRDARRRPTSSRWRPAEPARPQAAPAPHPPVDTVVALTCAPIGNRWEFTVAALPGGGPLQQTVRSVDDIPFTAVDLLALTYRFRPWRLRLAGPDLSGLFAAGRSARRARSDHTGQWNESWTAIVDGDEVIIAVRAVRAS